MKDGKPHILVVSQYFYPEQFRINDICVEWIKRGYQVTVLTGIPNYPEGSFYPGYGWLKKNREHWKGVDIIRIPIIARGKSRYQLCANYASFVFTGFFWHLFTRLEADFVYIYEVSPMTQALVGCWYAKRRSIPCYLYVTDLWPENVTVITGIKNRLLLRPVEMMVRYIYSHCSRIFISSKSFVPSIEEKGVSGKKIVYWPQYAEDCYYKTESKKEGKEKILRILFAGNIGEAQGLGILPRAAQEIKKRGFQVQFILLGDGRYKERLMNLVKKHQVEGMISFLGQKPKEQIAGYMADCDVALISLVKNPVFAMTVPAKTQSCMACGKPILVCADGEVKNLVLEAGCGLCAEAENINELTAHIISFIEMPEEERKEMGNNAVKYYKKYFDKELLLNQMDEYFRIRG